MTSRPIAIELSRFAPFAEVKVDWRCLQCRSIGSGKRSAFVNLFKTYVVYPDLACPGQENSKGYAGRIFRNIEHDVIHLPILVCP